MLPSFGEVGSYVPIYRFVETIESSGTLVSDFTKLINNLFRSGNISDENKGLIAELERYSETDFETELGHYLSQLEKSTLMNKFYK
jgi:hypothetical protein